MIFLKVLDGQAQGRMLLLNDDNANFHEQRHMWFHSITRGLALSSVARYLTLSWFRLTILEWGFRFLWFGILWPDNAALLFLWPLPNVSNYLPSLNLYQYQNSVSPLTRCPHSIPLPLQVQHLLISSPKQQLGCLSFLICSEEIPALENPVMCSSTFEPVKRARPRRQIRWDPEDKFVETIPPPIHWWTMFVEFVNCSQ